MGNKKRVKSRESCPLARKKKNVAKKKMGEVGFKEREEIQRNRSGLT